MAPVEAELSWHRIREELLNRSVASASAFAKAAREEARREAELTLRKARAAAAKQAALAHQIERDRATAERELERVRGLAQEMQAGLADFLTTRLEQLHPEPEAPAAEPAPAEGVQEALAGALAETFKQEDNELPAEGGGVSSMSTDS
jgi:hypothetical protein